MDNAYQLVRDRVVSTLTWSGKDAALAYIASLDDPDYRDAARVHLAKFTPSALYPNPS